jgi:hypothetical protein
MPKLMEPKRRKSLSGKSLKNGISVLTNATMLDLNGIVLQNQQPQKGWGACSVNGCHCQAYMGNDDTCQNCGHNYSLHW